LAFRLFEEARRLIFGSLSSEKPLAISRPAMNSSKRSAMSGLLSLRRASGLTSAG
jgi:hypothetical protein